MSKKIEIFQHFESILDELIKRSVFFKTYLQYPEYIGQDVIGGQGGIPANISLATGVTRACIIDDDYDWVVKFDIEEDGRGSACERENYTYKRAQLYDLSQYFSEVVYLGVYRKTYTFYQGWKVANILYYNDFNYTDNDYARDFFKYKDKFGSLEQITVSIPLYAYRKVSQEGFYTRSENESVIESEIKGTQSPLSEKNKQVAINFISNYGVHEYEKLTDFLYEMDINDFHSGNVGFIDDKFVLIDYAGYYDPDCESDEEEENDRWNS